MTGGQHVPFVPGWTTVVTHPECVNQLHKTICKVEKIPVCNQLHYRYQQHQHQQADPELKMNSLIFNESLTQTKQEQFAERPPDIWNYDRKITVMHKHTLCYHLIMI